MEDVFQKEIERGNGYITIHGLTEGQGVLLRVGVE